MANMKFPIHLIAKNDTKKAFREVESDTKRVGNQLRNVAAALGGAFAVNEIRKMADEITDLRNRLTSFSGSAQVASDQIDLIEKVALRTRGTFEGTALAFSRMVQATQQMEISNEDLAKATATLNATFRLSGTSAYETTNSMRQLTQAFASGRLSGDEMRSVLENNVVLANLLADGFGTTVGGLREMGAAGKVVAEDMFPILINAFEDTTTRVDAMDFTIDNAFARLKIRAYQAVRDFDEMTGASKNFAIAVKTLSDNLLGLAVIIGAVLIPALTRLLPVMAGFVAALATMAATFAVSNPFTIIAIAGLGLLVAFQKVRVWFHNNIIKLFEVDIPAAGGNLRIAFLELVKSTRIVINTLATAFAKGIGEVPIFFEQMKVDILKTINELTKNLLEDFKPIVDLFNMIRDMRGEPPIDISNLFGNTNQAQSKVDAMRKKLDELQINLFDNTKIDEDIDLVRFLIEDLRNDFKKIGEDEVFSLENLLFGTRSQAGGGIAGNGTPEKIVSKTRELMDKIGKEMENFRNKQKSFAQNLAEIINKGFDQLSQTITDFVLTSKNKLSDLINMITRELLNAMIMAGIVNPLRTGFENYLNRDQKGAGDYSQRAEDVIGFMFGNPAGKQGGGFVSRNTPYMVGEKGEELFIPSTSGKVIPNHALAGGGNITINQSVNFATGVQDTVKNEVLQLLPEIAETSKGAVLEAMSRGGNFRRGLR